MFARPRQVRAGCALAGALFWTFAVMAQRPPYPASPAKPVDEMLHGQTVTDPFRWLEDGDDKAVRAWTDEQNALTRAVLGEDTDRRAALRAELERLYAEDVGTSPRRFGDRLFFRKRAGTQNHPAVCVREGGLAAASRVVLDPNKIDPTGNITLDWYYPSPGGDLIAYGISENGTEMSTLRVRVVATGKDLDLAIPHAPHCVVSWDADSRGFCYTRLAAPLAIPASDRPYYRHVYHHVLGTKWQHDAKVWGDEQPKELTADVRNSSDGRFQFLDIEHGFARNDLHIRATGEETFEPMATGLDALHDGDVLGERVLVRTNHKAPRFRIVAAPIDTPTPDHWRDLISEQNGVIAGFTIAGGKIIVNVMENAFSRLLIYDAAGTLAKEIELPALGSVSQVTGHPDRPDLFFRFESFAHPPTVYHYDLGAHTLAVHDRLEIDLDVARYETRQVWFDSLDGTRVPMFVTRLKSLKLDGSAPAVLTAFGGFNVSVTPALRRDVLPWLDAGGVWAVANVRGGGEFGREWHLAGRLEKKQNCVDDFIAAAEKLVSDKFAAGDRIGAYGTGNGGLLVAAAMVQRPGLFHAVHCGVPLLDMVRYHRFGIARFWIGEYGSIENPEQFTALHGLSPYHRVQAGVDYPAVLLTSAEGDTRVDPLHARKMAARLQTCTTGDRPILLSVAPRFGHTRSARPLPEYIAEQVDVWTLFFWQLGLWDEEPATQPAASSAPTSGPAG